MTTTIPHTQSADAETAEDGAEARMRLALGKLGTTPPKQNSAPHRSSQQTAPGFPRHRFKQDGEIPVVRLVLSHGGRGKERAAPVFGRDAGARDEHPGEGRDQHGEESTRAVQELTEQLHVAQTRLGHAEMALAEAGAATRASQEEAAALRRALEESQAHLAQAHAERLVQKQAPEVLEGQAATPQQARQGIHAAQAAPVRRKVGRPQGSTKFARNQNHAREPKPVKWWAGD